MQNLQTDLIKLLEKDERFTKDGKLLKNSVIEAALNLDPSLMKLLLSHKSLKKHFFQQVEVSPLAKGGETEGVLVFDKIEFQKFVSNKSFLKDSYTAYSNKIGLTVDDEFISEGKQVVLSWPYKDCVLEGGQTKEDEKREEIFWNETLAPDEIDRLLSPKVFTNFKKYDSKGEHTVTDISLEDNLIIKGNNLLALHSLLPVYSGKVKLIYIDPPYNTGNDSFQYNDNFNHSTWLTFMKNRLEIAKSLLNYAGVIFVHCDNNEQAHLKILLDEIFERKNFIETITVVNNPRGRDYGGIANMHEFIHVYARDIFQFEMYRLIDTEKEFEYSDSIGSYDIRELRNRNTAFNDKNRPNLCYPFFVNPSKEIDNGFLEISLEHKKGFKEIWPAKSQGIQTVWRWSKEKADKNLNINIVAKKMQEDGRYMIIEKYRDNSRLARSVWWDKEVNSERGTVHLRELFGNKVFSFPKPETLLSRIISIATNEGDLVLDYHLGSGTTATSAHKMNRKYIGIEQMDYIEDVSCERLQKVISGEDGGISKQINWKGGGSFIYCELNKLNEIFIEKITKSSTTKDLKQIWTAIKKYGFISFKINPKVIDDSVTEFEELSLEDQKKFLIAVLDKNHLYVNYTEIEDKDYKISDEDKKLNKKFYSLK